MNSITKQNIAKLSPAKRALLERQMQKKKSPAQAHSIHPTLDRLGPLPLSFAQQRLWFADRLKPGDPVLNRPTHFRLTGSLNVAALAQSLNEIICRHETLRSQFPTENGQPFLKIKPSLSISLPVIDLSLHAATERAEQVQQIIQQENQQPFDLAEGPLIRRQLLKLDADEHLLLITLHHTIFDGWSADILKQEIAVLYSAFSAGKTSPLSALSIQYADFAHWQRQQLDKAKIETQLKYWTSQLGGELPILTLPTDRPRSIQTSASGATHTFFLSQSLTNALTTLSQRQGVTLFMTLLSAFKVLLYRYTGQTDVIVGVPIAGRDRVETESLIGVFINTLALRTTLSDNPTVRELLKRVRATSLEARLVYGATQATQFRLRGPGQKRAIAEEIIRKLPASPFNHMVKAGLVGRVRYTLNRAVGLFRRPYSSSTAEQTIESSGS